VTLAKRASSMVSETVPLRRRLSNWRASTMTRQKRGTRPDGTHWDASGVTSISRPPASPVAGPSPQSLRMSA
jgi:hypothetical protein